MIEASVALREIRERRLYRATYSTFEEYCQNEHGLSPQHVNNMIRAGRTLQEMETIVSGQGIPLPSNEAQLRVLSRVSDPIERCQVYREVCKKAEEAGGKKVTAASILKHLETLPPAAELAGTGKLKAKERMKLALTVVNDLAARFKQGVDCSDLLERLKQLLAA